MKQKPQRRVLAVLLALLVSLSACVPALAASGNAGEASGERATLGELIALDRAYLEGVYQAMEKAGKQSSLPAWNEHTELAALAAVLVSQQMLVEEASRAQFRNVTESLREGKEPTLAAEQIKLIIRELDLYWLHDVLMNSVPARWSEVSEPNDAMRRQLKKSGGQTVHGDSSTSFAMNQHLFQNTEGGLHYDVDASIPIYFYPMFDIYTNGYQMMTFRVVYNGTGTINIDGFSEIQIQDLTGSTVYAGGYPIGDSNIYFRQPIQVHSGESAYFAVLFDPGTWYDLSFDSLYGADGKQQFAVQMKMINHPES